MELRNLLEKRKTEIVRKWFDAVADTYPADTSRFLKSQKDPFANPVGSTTLHGLQSAFEEILSQGNPERIREFLDPIIRIRAVQSFTASHATAFVFYLKHLVKELADKEACKPEEIFDFWSKLDAVALIAFDIYMTCREKVYEIKASEQRDRTFRAFHRAGLVNETPEDKPGLE
ncbi:MAG: hypothetical protein BWK80_05575 [Desulfobacteraceae bacterium IS3]|nr:MAG: hypothetical protein BWK80_05575 [Desulfobacteraceae bacterium IS3]HAO22436.1 hypothetical protein [Desulfobacteraceae bacterium]